MSSSFHQEDYNEEEPTRTSPSPPFYCFCGKCQPESQNCLNSKSTSGPVASCFLNFSSSDPPQSTTSLIDTNSTLKMSSTPQKMAALETSPSNQATPLADFSFPKKQKKGNEDENSSTEDDDKYIYNPTTMPIVSLSQGLAKKASPWLLASWVKLALTLDGRDKITKVCQYSSRMLAWWFAAMAPNPHQVQRFKSMQTSLTTSRKAFRLGRSFIEVQKIRDAGLLELFFNPNNNTKSKDPAWQVVGTCMKMIGLMGFWAGDNVNYLAGGGLFDNMAIEDPKQRMAQRNNLKTKAAVFANRFYFFGSVTGLLTALRVYWCHRQTSIRDAHERLVEATKQVQDVLQHTKGVQDVLQQKVLEPDEEIKTKLLWRDAKAALDKAREKQFVLFLGVLKGCVDVMVFSNNPGIDLHQKYRGKKNHEGFHCLCGLLSASTVLYNNYPNDPKK